MKAAEIKHIATNADGTEEVEATVIASEVPETLPTTGEGITGMNSNQRFAPFSTIVVITENGLLGVFIADENGVFRRVLGETTSSTPSEEGEENE